MSPHGPDARISHARQQPSAQLVIVIYGATTPAIVCTGGAGIRGEIAPQVAGPLITALRSPARLSVRIAGFAGFADGFLPTVVDSLQKW
jgi:hypothetical protein